MRKLRRIKYFHSFGHGHPCLSAEIAASLKGQDLCHLGDRQGCVPHRTTEQAVSSYPEAEVGDKSNGLHLFDVLATVSGTHGVLNYPLS